MGSIVSILIKEVVLGFILREVEDLPDVCLIDLAEVSCSRRLSELHWALHARRLLDQIGFDPVHPCFYLAVWFQRECREALLDVTLMWYDFSFHSEAT
jgi:hypothetical protein